MKRIALICGDDGSLDWSDWHHYGFWYRTMKARPDLSVDWWNWLNWRQMPKEYDLYLFLDFRHSLWQVCDTDYHPRVLYWWDAFHHMFSVVAQTPLAFDKVYVAELVDAAHLRSVGFSNAEWLPAAFHPGLYRPIGTPKTRDFAFVGQLDDTVVRSGLTRRRMMVRLSERFNGELICGVRGVPVNEAYNRAKILPERTIFANVGTRLFETVGSGGFCLMNRFPCNTGLDQIGLDGVHFATYDESQEDLMEKMSWWLAHDVEREKVAAAGHEHFLAHHTYEHRLNKILKDFNLT